MELDVFVINVTNDNVILYPTMINKNQINEFEYLLLQNDKYDNLIYQISIYINNGFIKLDNNDLKYIYLWKKQNGLDKSYNDFLKDILDLLPIFKN